MTPSSPNRESGAALLTILMIVSIMSVAALAAVSALSRSIDLTRSASNRSQSGWAEMSATAIGAPILEHFIALSENGTLPDEMVTLPFERGVITIKASDASNCFNLNQLGATDATLAEERYQSLLVTLGFFESEARALSDSLSDWLDADNNPRPFGQESSFYARKEKPYNAGNTLLENTTELRSIEGYSPDILERIEKFICTRPDTVQPALNISALKRQDAPLLVSLFSSELKLETAENIILGRPIAGWQSSDEFLLQPQILQIADIARNDDMVAMKPSHITLHATIQTGDAIRHVNITYSMNAGAAPQIVAKTNRRAS